MRKKQRIISKFSFDMLEHQYYFMANVKILRKQVVTFRGCLLLHAPLL